MRSGSDSEKQMHNTLVYMRVAALSCVTERVQMILSRFKT
jgi:hypothetical protein